MYIGIYLYTIAISGQECTGPVTVGYTSHNSCIVLQHQTYILAEYTVPCNVTVISWEFCYQTGNEPLTFYPGIWRITEMMGNPDYALVQSNTIIFDASINTGGIDHNHPCQRVNLSTTDQFTAPAGSVVGLHSTFPVQLLHTSTDNSITTYQFSGNQSSVSVTGNANDVNYNIAIRVYLGKYV